MKNLALLAALLSGAAHAADIAATDDCAKPALSLLLHELPADIQRLLGRGRPGIGGLADTNERFSASDAIGLDFAPMTRFRWAGQGDGCYAVTLERGGIARHIETAVLRHLDGAWRILGTRVPYPEEIGVAGNAPDPVAEVYDSVDVSTWGRHSVAK